LNLKGEVVGINTVKVASAEGIGFAVPINVAIPIINKFATTGEFIEPYLGVFAYDKDIIPYLDGNVKVQNGVYVANVDENGPAYKSGIRVGCIMTQIDGEEISTMMQLRCVIYSKTRGCGDHQTYQQRQTPDRPSQACRKRERRTCDKVGNMKLPIYI